ncbi:MAG TPA: O-antigen ligase family protein, partial [Dissulfurispiraceae bacterium]|nr:O-antigen ligase family protein [Dissulfurispiraceae bacterium]
MRWNDWKTGAPLLLWIIVASTMVACIGGSSFLGYSISGYAWAVPLAAALVYYLVKQGRITFPVHIWIPWIAVVLIYLSFAEAENAFQRSIMILCPLLIGIAVSAGNYTAGDLAAFRKACCWLGVVLCVSTVFKTGMHLTGTLPKTSGLAPEVMTGALLCTIFATNYMFGSKPDLYWWAALAMIPVVALTRMGIFAAGLSLPLTFAPMKLLKRLVLAAMIVIAGYSFFFTERVQQKTFYSGSGTFQDIRWDNPNLATSGRRYIWDHMQGQIDSRPWFGHGANASEPFVLRLTGAMTHPHNDWLRLLYDYGYVGTVTFAFCMLWQMVHLLRTGMKTAGMTRILFYAGASSFLVFSLFMSTDNIILYA